MDNCHRAENSVKFDKDSFTYVSSALIQNSNSFNAVDESNINSGSNHLNVCKLVCIYTCETLTKLNI